ncbi:MAG: hypothetical protein KGL04_10235, partial [Elusimicrobia bacterium]|nr:hypothetical protein [Elusimicrobiota bacterium]
GQRGQVRVLKHDDGEHDWAYVGTYPFESFSLDVLRDGYGGGRYRLVLLDGAGKYVKGGSQACLIAQPPKKEGAAAEPPRDRALDLVIENLKEQNRQSTELLKAVLAKPEPQRQGLGEILDGLAKVRSLTPESPRTSLREIVETMSILKGLSDGDSKENGGVLGEILEAFRAVKEMGIGGRRAAEPDPEPAQPAAVPRLTAGGAVSVPPGVKIVPSQETKPVSNQVDAELKARLDYSAGYFIEQAHGPDADTDESVERAAEDLLSDFERFILPTLAKKYHAPRDMVYAEVLRRGKDPKQIESLLANMPSLADKKDWCLRVIAKAIEQAEADD